VADVAADASLAAWLGVDKGTPLLRLDEAFFTRSGEPVLFSMNHFRTDKVGFHIVRKVDRTWMGGGGQK
jgi:DNA-binding GntR family transcriptional regulator